MVSKGEIPDGMADSDVEFILGDSGEEENDEQMIDRIL